MQEADYTELEDSAAPSRPHSAHGSGGGIVRAPHGFYQRPRRGRRPSAGGAGVGRDVSRAAATGYHLLPGAHRHDQIAGAVTLVARKGKVVHYEAQGWRHKEANVPMTHDTIFALASMTKPIVSAALMMLFEEGRFRLDDPISNWLPEYTDHQVRIVDGVRARVVPEARPVTVRHVLTHTSGLTLNPEGRGLTQEQNQRRNQPRQRLRHATRARQVCGRDPRGVSPWGRVAIRRFDRSETQRHREKSCPCQPSPDVRSFSVSPPGGAGRRDCTDPRRRFCSREWIAVSPETTTWRPMADS